MPIINGTPGNDFITGTPGNDTINGFAGDDQLFGDPNLPAGGNDLIDGGDGDDFIRGRAGDDTLLGGNGDDFLEGGPGNDSIAGGAGIDRLAFTSATNGVSVDLNLQGTPQNTGAGVDVFTGIEHVSGTGFADTLTGDGGDNFIWGEGGADSLSGGAGNDLVQINQGDGQTADGGAGVDTASFEDAGIGEPHTGGAQVSLALQGAVQDTGRGLITLTGFENLSGTTYGDTLTGDSGANLLAGFAGDDQLAGGDGDDLLLGDGAVRMQTVNGGSGPIVTYQDASAVFGFPGGADSLSGGAGNDTLVGGAGDDQLDGGSGDNRLDGGDGFDTAGYATAAGPITLFGNQVDHGDGTDTLVGVERVVGSAFDDLMVGGPGNDDLDGGDGHDVLRGRAGDDTLVGGAGDDFLNPGQGNDSIDGGAGFDRVGFFQDATAGVHVDLNLDGAAQDTGMGVKTLTGIEHVSGTGFADTLVGNAGDNWVWGEGGNDSLAAGSGNDLVQLGLGTASDDIADGGAGVDTLTFDGNGGDTSGVRASLALQGAAQDTLRGMVTATGFENLSGSAFADTLSGDGGDNLLAGAAGDDSLSGGGGDDLLYGDGQVLVDTHGTGGSGPIVTLADASAFNQTAAGNDTLDGGSGADTLIGGGGADVLTGGKGADHFVFLSINDSTPAAHDLITDLENKDTIDLSAIDADVNTAGDQAFHLVGAFTHHAGEAVLDYDKALKVTHLSLDVNGDGVADAVIDIAGQSKNFSGFIF